MKIAIVHDYLREIGGAERVLAVLIEMFPEADVFTSYYHEGRVATLLSATRVRTTFIQRLPMLWRRPNLIDRLGKPVDKLVNAWALVLPLVFRRLDLSGYDLIISSSSYCAHHVRRGSRQTHICYCHTPARFIWQYPDSRTKAPLKRVIWDRVVSWLRNLDLAAAEGVDHFIVNSENVRDRVRKFYRRDSTVVYPPADLLERTPDFEPAQMDDGYYLVVGRLEPLKRVDAIVEAFNTTGDKLVVIGTGILDETLRKLGRENVTFTGFVSDEELCRYYDRTTAVVIAAEDEDFGITAVEAQLFGKPVIAVNEGGFRETVVDGETGLLFDFDGPDSIVQAVARARKITFDPGVIRDNAARFSKAAFAKRIFAELSTYGFDTHSEPQLLDQ